MNTAQSQSTPTEPSVVIQADTGSISLEDLKSQIDSTWLTRALSERFPGVAVKSVSITRVLAGCSVKAWVTVAYNEAGQRAGLPEVLVVKAGFARHSPIMQFTYESEMSAYRDVLPRFTLHAPRCFYAGKGPDQDSAAIIIEDLTLRGARFCHALTPLSFVDARSVLTALAGFHAQSWQDPALTDGSFPWAVRQRAARTELAAYQAAQIAPDRWAYYMQLPRSWAVPIVFHDRDHVLSALSRLQALGESEPQVVLMGDSHLGNLYFESDGTPGFLDFQSRVAPWSQEIAYFMAAALDIPDRRRWEGALLEHYLETLARHGVDAPQFDVAWHSYSRQLLFGLFVWLTNGPEFQTELVNTANAARLGCAVTDHRTLDLLTN